MQEESLDGPSVEEQKTQRSLRESEVRGSKTNRPGGCGLKVDDIGCEHGEKWQKTYENIWKLFLENTMNF